MIEMKLQGNAKRPLEAFKRSMPNLCGFQNIPSSLSFQICIYLVFLFFFVYEFHQSIEICPPNLDIGCVIWH